ncbi:TIGR03084 family metal-binding protein [Desulfatitalea tepidiphila]|uniref:TIGR03084 family metal-binding protein n=1 Tax=Desulfatitalea tepidiphila TaxID=1185843 RepID=UPI0006B6727D|nr:TIGR03084 family metal-binding protein [Desulfatitalea tepidiphila]
MKAICADLAWEQDTLDALVSGLAPDQWQLLAPCGRWTVKDEICHLAYFDHTARLAATDPEAFQRHLIEDLGRIKNMDEATEITLAKGRAMSIGDLLAWWRGERRQLVDALVRLDPKDRLPWYGPPMSARSFASARLMETWAHGQDIYDALAIERPVSPGLRHIAHLGVTTFGWSFANRGMAVPETPVRVELAAPSGEIWTWGDAAASQCISGPVVDFCQVVIQRRHVDDTALVVVGDVARQWMAVAQCFAGPPTLGPAPGTRVIQKHHT